MIRENIVGGFNHPGKYRPLPMIDTMQQLGDWNEDKKLRELHAIIRAPYGWTYDFGSEHMTYIYDERNNRQTVRQTLQGDWYVTFKGEYRGYQFALFSDEVLTWYMNKLEQQIKEKQG